MLCGVTRAPRECEGDESGGIQESAAARTASRDTRVRILLLGAGTRLREQPARVAARQRLLEVDLFTVSRL